MRAALLLTALLAASPSWAQNDSHQQGVNAGKAGVNAAKGYVNPASAGAVVPNYGASAGETAYYKQPNLSGAVSARFDACQRSPNDPSCQAILGAHRSASTPKPVISPTDPSIAGVRAIQANPGAIVGNLTGTYSECKPVDRAQSPELNDTQSCHTYYLREPDQSCVKELSVRLEYACPVGTIGPTGTGANRSCTSTTTGQVTVAAIKEVDQWSTGCAALESRVPAGMLPPDGDNSGVIPGGGGFSDFINKCERKASLCLDFEPRVIGGRTIQRACWKYQNLFDCLSLDNRSDCNQPRFGQCQQQGSPRCVDYDQFFSTQVCTAWQTDYKCKVRDATTERVADCGNRTYTLQGTQWDTSYPPDQDFGKSVAMLEMQREAGRYLDQNSLRVFKGVDNRCVKKLFGLVNCCNKGGSGASAFTNMAILLASGRAATGAIGSSYTYDALFMGDSPDFVLKGFEVLFGTGGSSALAGMLAGELSVASFMTTLVPGPWTIAMLAIQYSGLFTCPKEEQVMAMKRDANLCVGIGEYCSKKLPIIRTCMERTSTYCCFNSKLARIINEQGKKQLGQGWGTPESPNCSGFSVAELQSLNFAAMDLREFYAEIVPKPADIGKFTTNVTGKIENCYYGQGQCPK